MADPVRQSNSLPSLSYLDLEKIKKETAAYAHNIPVSAALNMAAPPLVSPSIYSGPPPPYSYPSSAASSVVGVNNCTNGSNGYMSPPESRHTSDQEKEAPQPPKIQSLPSIHEALGKEQHISISSLLSKSATATQSSRTATHCSPTSPISRSHPDTSIRPPNTISQPPPPSNYRPQDPLDNPRPRFSPQLPKDIGAARFQPPPTHQYSPSQKPRASPSPVEPTKSMAHTLTQLRQTSPSTNAYPRSFPPNTHNYTYSPYHPTYTYPMPPPSIPSYQPPQTQPPPPTWRSVGSDLDRAEEARKAAKSSPITTSFGETVKRHLDRFDLETSLNEIAEGSGRALSFSREYGEKAHHTARAGLSSDSMPTLTECDDMIKRQRGVLASMERIREVIVKQQQDLAEQRSRSQGFKPPTEYDEEGLYGDKLDGGGGFNGPDAKKRKGRAAPPGRCHSCNRAETPEWRRGPDGARTLCNACGLHYAKLTRKMGSKTSSTGSSLRPKEASPGLTQ